MWQTAPLPTVSPTLHLQSRDEARLRELTRLLWQNFFLVNGERGFEGAIQGGLAPIIHRYCRIPISWKSRFSSQAAAWAAESMFLERELREFLSIVAEVSVPILLKGSDLVPLLYLGDFSLRPMDDVDLFVQPASFDATRGHLEKRGFLVRVPFNGSHVTMKHPNFRFPLELHCSLSRRGESLLQNLASRAIGLKSPSPWRPAGGESPICRHMRPGERVSYLLYHLWKHSFPVGKWLLDLILLMDEAGHADIFQGCFPAFAREVTGFLNGSGGGKGILPFYLETPGKRREKERIFSRVLGTLGFLERCLH